MRTGYNPGRDIICFFSSFYNRGKSPEIFNASVGTTSDKNIIDFLSQHRLLFMEAHVLKGFCEACLSCIDVFGRWNQLRDAHAHARIGTVGDHRLNLNAVIIVFDIKGCIFICFQGLPVSQCIIPGLSCWRFLAAFDITESSFIGSNHSTTCTHFNAHVTNRHAAFHAHVFKYRTGIFHKITSGTRSSQF